MSERSAHTVSEKVNLLLPRAARMAVFVFCMVCESTAQSSNKLNQETTETLSFDVASIREDKPGLATGETQASNVPLGPGNVYSPTGGLFRATGFPLLSYIAFAYRMTDGQLESFRSMAPEWVTRDKFDIQARTEKIGVTKDQLRLMVRSLIAERFAMSAHYETRQVSVYELQLAQPGVTGPKLQPHSEGSSCSSTLPNPATLPSTPETTSGGFPTTCGGIVLLPSTVPHRYNIGGRDMSVNLLANSLSGWGSLDHPVVDKTGLVGNFDFALEFTPEQNPGSLTSPSLPVETEGSNFRQALKQQLGLRLQPKKGEVQVVVLDHIDDLTEN